MACNMEHNVLIYTKVLEIECVLKLCKMASQNQNVNE